MSSTLDFVGDDAWLDDGPEAPLDAGAVVVGVSEPDVGGGPPVSSGLCDPGSGEVTGVLPGPLEECFGDASPTVHELTAASSNAHPAAAMAARRTCPR
jgi:hypothetical protein